MLTTPPVRKQHCDGIFTDLNPIVKVVKDNPLVSVASLATAGIGAIVSGAVLYKSFTNRKNIYPNPFASFTFKPKGGSFTQEERFVQSKHEAARGKYHQEEKLVLLAGGGDANEKRKQVVQQQNFSIQNSVVMYMFFDRYAWPKNGNVFSNTLQTFFKVIDGLKIDEHLPDIGQLITECIAFHYDIEQSLDRVMDRIPLSMQKIEAHMNKHSRFLIMGGYLNDGSGHAMMYFVDVTEKEKILVMVNSGEGLHYHLAYKGMYQLIRKFRFKRVETLVEAVFRIINDSTMRVVQDGKSANFNIEEVYANTVSFIVENSDTVIPFPDFTRSVLSQRTHTQDVFSDNKYTIDKGILYSPSQESGSCTYFSMLWMMYYLLKDKSNALPIEQAMKRRVIKDLRFTDLEGCDLTLFRLLVSNYYYLTETNLKIDETCKLESVSNYHRPVIDTKVRTRKKYLQPLDLNQRTFESNWQEVMTSKECTSELVFRIEELVLNMAQTNLSECTLNQEPRAVLVGYVLLSLMRHVINLPVVNPTEQGMYLFAKAMVFMTGTMILQQKDRQYEPFDEFRVLLFRVFDVLCKMNQQIGNHRILALEIKDSNDTKIYEIIPSTDRFFDVANYRRFRYLIFKGEEDKDYLKMQVEKWTSGSRITPFASHSLFETFGRPTSAQDAFNKFVTTNLVGASLAAGVALLELVTENGSWSRKVCPTPTAALNWHETGWRLGQVQRLKREPTVKHQDVGQQIAIIAKLAGGQRLDSIMKDAKSDSFATLYMTPYILSEGFQNKSSKFVLDELLRVNAIDEGISCWIEFVKVVLLRTFVVDQLETCSNESLAYYLCQVRQFALLGPERQSILNVLYRRPGLGMLKTVGMLMFGGDARLPDAEIAAFLIDHVGSFNSEPLLYITAHLLSQWVVCSSRCFGNVINRLTGFLFFEGGTPSTYYNLVSSKEMYLLEEPFATSAHVVSGYQQRGREYFRTKDDARMIFDVNDSSDLGNILSMLRRAQIRCSVWQRTADVQICFSVGLDLCEIVINDNGNHLLYMNGHRYDIMTLESVPPICREWGCHFKHAATFFVISEQNVILPDILFITSKQSEFRVADNVFRDSKEPPIALPDSWFVVQLVRDGMLPVLRDNQNSWILCCLVIASTKSRCVARLWWNILRTVDLIDTQDNIYLLFLSRATKEFFGQPTTSQDQIKWPPETEPQFEFQPLNRPVNEDLKTLIAQRLSIEKRYPLSDILFEQSLVRFTLRTTNKELYAKCLESLRGDYVMLHQETYLHQFNSPLSELRRHIVWQNTVLSAYRETMDSLDADVVGDKLLLLHPYSIRDYQTKRTLAEQLFECVSGRFITNEQVTYLDQMRNNAQNGRPSIMQAIMGIGKSSVLMPVIVLEWLIMGENVIIVQPEHLVSATIRILHEMMMRINQLHVSLVCNKFPSFESFETQHVVVVSDTVLKRDLFEIPKLCFQKSAMLFDEIDVMADPLTSEFNESYDPIKHPIVAAKDMPTYYSWIYDYASGKLHEEKDELHKKLSHNISTIQGYREGLDYGLSIADSTNPLAIPYRAGQTPCEGSSFSDPDVTALLSAKLRISQLLERDVPIVQKAVAILVRDLDRQLGALYFQEVICPDAQSSIEEFLGMHPPVFVQKLGNNHALIRFFITQVMLPQYINCYKMQYNRSFMDIMNLCTTKNAFSGTTNMVVPKFPMNNPFMTRIVVSPVAQGSMDRIIQEAQVHVVEDINSLLSSAKRYDCLIDESALLLNFTENEVRIRLGITRPFVCFGIDNKPITLVGSDSVVPYEAASPDCFYYFSQKHSRGSDLVLPPKAKGLVIIDDSKSTHTSVSQAAFRMRKLHYGHTVDFIRLKPPDGIPQKQSLLNRLNDNECRSSLERRFSHAVQNYLTYLRFTNHVFSNRNGLQTIPKEEFIQRVPYQLQEQVYPDAGTNLVLQDLRKNIDTQNRTEGLQQQQQHQQQQQQQQQQENNKRPRNAWDCVEEYKLRRPWDLATYKDIGDIFPILGRAMNSLRVWFSPRMIYLEKKQPVPYKCALKRDNYAVIMSPDELLALNCSLSFRNVIFPSFWTLAERNPHILLLYFMMGVTLSFLQETIVLCSCLKEAKVEEFAMLVNCGPDLKHSKLGQRLQSEKAARNFVKELSIASDKQIIQYLVPSLKTTLPSIHGLIHAYWKDVITIVNENGT